MFSSRLPADLEPNPLSRATARARAAGIPLLDLTVTNPTAVGLEYPPDLTASLSAPEGRTYAPEPHGSLAVRESVAQSYAARASVAADSVTLTASTSEAYSFLFKLLCNPGDSVLVPRPSYPLFELLTQLDGIHTCPYRLDPAGRWSIDRGIAERAMRRDTKAILVVSPNNPTGSMLRAADREWLVSLAMTRGVAIISDEVFFDYPLRPLPDAVSLAGESRVLTFTLGGLSKSAGLPQMKLGWIVTSGPEPIVRDAMDRLAIIADTYLSVSTPVQVAADRLMSAGAHVRTSIARRIQRNLQRLELSISDYSEVTLLAPEGGWAAVLRVPATEPEEALVLRLLEDAHVLVHPGYFFDFSEEAFLVISLLPEPLVFDEGVSKLLATIRGRQL